MMARALPRAGWELATYALAAAGAMLAMWLNVPLALLIGPMIALSVASQRFPNLTVSLPVYALSLFLMGLSLGQYFTPDLISTWGDIALSLLLNTGLTLVGLTLGYLLLRKVLGYNPATAVLSGLPGGILTVLEVARESDADFGAVLFFQIFRIVLGASLFPLAYAIAGFDIPPTGVTARPATVPPGVFEITLLVGGGLALAFVGRKLRFPSAEISLPLIWSAALYGSGTISFAIPLWVPAAGFVLVGASVGTMLPRPGAAGLIRLSLHTLMVFAVFSVLTVLCAALAVGLLGIPLATGILTFSPASLTEMIALAVALEMDPALVAANNLFRMLFCSVLAPILVVLMRRGGAKG